MRRTKEREKTRMKDRGTERMKNAIKRERDVERKLYTERRDKERIGAIVRKMNKKEISEKRNINK